jgi:hypothetical protein
VGGTGDSGLRLQLKDAREERALLQDPGPPNDARGGRHPEIPMIRRPQNRLKHPDDVFGREDLR